MQPPIRVGEGPERPGARAASLGVVLPAAGSGRRMGGRAKPFLELAGRPLLAWVLETFLKHAATRDIVVVLPPDLAVPPWIEELAPAVHTVAGGATRTESVSNGVGALDAGSDLVCIHDAARPLLRSAWLDACLEVARDGAGAVVGVPATDTIKRVSGDGTVIETPDRRELWQIQTPQVFPRAMIEQAVERARREGWSGTDDAALVERCGGTVRVVPGDRTNLKITVPADLALAQFLMSRNDRSTD